MIFFPVSNARCSISFLNNDGSSPVCQEGCIPTGYRCECCCTNSCMAAMEGRIFLSYLPLLAARRKKYFGLKLYFLCNSFIHSYASNGSFAYYSGRQRGK